MEERMKDELKKKDKELKNKLKGKEVQDVLDKVQGDIEDTVRDLLRINKELEKDDLPKEERDRLKKEADALMGKLKGLEKNKDMLDKRLKKAMTLGPDQQDKAKDEIAEISKEAEGLRGEAVKDKEQAARLAD